MTPAEGIRPGLSEPDDLDFVAPLGVGRTLAGRRLQLSPIRVGELPKLLACLEPLLAEAVALVRDTGLRDRLQAGEPDADDWVNLAALLAAHGEGLLNAMAIMARVEPEWVHALSIDRAVSLLADLLRVNLDFFARAVPTVKDQLLRPDPAPAPAPGAAAQATSA